MDVHGLFEVGGEFPDGFFFGGDEGEELLHLGGEPADARIAVVAARWLGDAVAIEEGPVLWSPVVVPEAVFGDDEVAEGFFFFVSIRETYVGGVQSARDLIDNPTPELDRFSRTGP